MPKIRALTPIRFDRKRRPTGTAFDVDEATAEKLIAERKADSAEEAPSRDQAERVTAIAKAVEALTDADWTSGGTPKVSTVAKASGLADVTAEELAGFRKPEA